MTLVIIARLFIHFCNLYCRRCSCSGDGIDYVIHGYNSGLLFFKLKLLILNTRMSKVMLWNRRLRVKLNSLKYVSKNDLYHNMMCLSPERRQAIKWTNAGILSIGTLGINFSEILSEMHTLSFKKKHLKRHLRNGGHSVLASMCLTENVAVSWLRSGTDYMLITAQCWLSRKVIFPVSRYHLEGLTSNLGMLMSNDHLPNTLQFVKVYHVL